MSCLVISETDKQIQLRWLGLHVAFAKDATLPPAWRDVIATPASEAAIYDWLMAFGHLNEPGEPLPGDTLHVVADPTRRLLSA